MSHTSISALLVEDDRYQLEAMADNLRLDGFDIHGASNAEEALTIMEGQGDTLSLGILDIDLPGKVDGIELLERIKLRWPTVDVVILSGKATARNAAAALNLGASSFLFKPCDPEHLVRILHSLHEKQSLQIHNASMLRQLAQLKNEVAANGLDFSPIPRPNGPGTQSLVHEISNQLTILLGNFDLLLDEDAESLKEHAQIERMRNVTLRIQNILSNHRHSRGGLMPTALNRCDLREIVDDLLDQCSHLLKTQGVGVHLPFEKDPIPLRCDRSQIEQLLTNLFLNAIEAMPHGGILELDLSFEPIASPPCLGKRTVKLTVRDTGTGIAPAILPNLFDRFMTNKSDGNGLGLFLAREIARNHGGDLVGKNTAEGASFEVILPLAALETKD